jgi:hypothetical protein
MSTILPTANRTPEDERRYALGRGPNSWDLTFQDQHANFNHEPGALFVARLLLYPPPEPIHAVALALEARTLARRTLGADEVIRLRSLGLDEAETVRTLRRRERELEAVLDDKREIEPVKAEALRELEAITDFLRSHPWRSRDCAQKCIQAVSVAIQVLVAHLARAVDAEGNPEPVLRAFAWHLDDHLLLPSLRSRIQRGGPDAALLAGWFTYAPPPGVVWIAGTGLQ